MILDRRRFLVSTALAASGPMPSRGAGAQTPAAAAPIMLDAHPLPTASVTAGRPALGFGGDGYAMLRVRTGVPSSVRLANHLDEPTGLDWHGMRLPNALDLASGLGGEPVAPGGTRDMTLTPTESGTYWFHPPFTPGLADQTSHGLAGVLIVEEPDAPAVDADHVLLLTDRMAGGAEIAEQLLINGKAWPESSTHAPGSRLRLRLVNGSTRQAVAVTFSGASAFVVAIDGQPSDLFRPLNDTIPVGPGARFDVMVDLARETGAEFRLTLQGSEAVKSAVDRPVFVARTDGTPVPDRQTVHALTPNAALPRYIPLENSVRADVTALFKAGPPGLRTGPPGLKAGPPGRWTINGLDGTVLAKKPLFTAKTSSPVTLAFNNRSAKLIAFRLHGHVMRLLHSKDDGWEPYWRDSVIVPAGGTYHVAFLADNPGRWLIESPFFDQAARGLRCWFEVT